MLPLPVTDWDLPVPGPSEWDHVYPLGPDCKRWSHFSWKAGGYTLMKSLEGITLMPMACLNF